MTNNFDKILDECIDRINRGQSLEACLNDYPEYAEQLRPLLQVMVTTKDTYSFVPSTSTKRAARQRLNAAIDRLEQKRWEKQNLWGRLFARPLAWATVAAIILIIAGVFTIRPLLYPGSPVAVPDPEGNFVFLISDDVNAIEDFESLTVSISKIGLLPNGSSDWIEFKPEVEEVDLTLVKGDKTQEIWKGNLPEGQYSNIFIYVTDVSGILKETGQETEVKLPSNKLHISKPFKVTTDTVTSFTYDLTVISAGSSQSGIKYILKPQVDQSGAQQTPSNSKGKDKGKSNNRNNK